MPRTINGISGNDGFSTATREAAAQKCTTPARRRESTPDSRRPFLTVRNLRRVPTVKRRRRSTRSWTFPFSLPRRQQLLLLDLPELRLELARRQRLLIAQLALGLMSGGVGLNAAARLLGVSASRLCTWCQSARRIGSPLGETKSRASRLSERTPCKISFYLSL